MPDDPIYNSLLDISKEDISGIFDDIDNTYGKVNAGDFKQWVNNQTRLNAFNMNNLNSLIQSYGNWVGSTVYKYLNTYIIQELIENSAGWSYKLADPQAEGEVYNDYTNNTARGYHAAAFGTSNNADNENQFVIGKFSKSNPDAVFIVGWGESGAENNIFTVLKDGRVQIPASALPKDDGDLVNKGHLDSEIERIKQLNQWIGTIHVSSETFNDSAAFQKALNDEVKNLSPSGRDYARNGDLITVIIDDKKPTDPQYPEVWIFLEDDPSDPKSHEGKWEFYSSQQELLNASKTIKGLVQIGDNINVNNGVISVPVATKDTLGVIKVGKSLSVDDAGSVSMQWNDLGPLDPYDPPQPPPSTYTVLNDGSQGKISIEGDKVLSDVNYGVSIPNIGYAVTYKFPSVSFWNTSVIWDVDETDFEEYEAIAFYADFNLPAQNKGYIGPSYQDIILPGLINEKKIVDNHFTGGITDILPKRNFWADWGVNCQESTNAVFIPTDTGSMDNVPANSLCYLWGKPGWYVFKLAKDTLAELKQSGGKASKVKLTGDNFWNQSNNSKDGKQEYNYGQKVTIGPLLGVKDYNEFINGFELRSIGYFDLPMDRVERNDSDLEDRNTVI